MACDDYQVQQQQQQTIYCGTNSIVYSNGSSARGHGMYNLSIPARLEIRTENVYFKYLRTIRNQDGIWRQISTVRTAVILYAMCTGESFLPSSVSQEEA